MMSVLIVLVQWIYDCTATSNLQMVLAHTGSSRSRGLYSKVKL